MIVKNLSAEVISDKVVMVSPSKYLEAKAVAKPKYYAFIDNARFLSILAIVLIHTQVIYTYEVSSWSWLVQMVYTQLPKFGTVCFFILSGFLLNDRFATVEMKPYFKKRFEQTMKPYCVWLSVFLLLQAIRPWIGNLRQTVKIDTLADYTSYLLHMGLSAIFASNYWFVLNLFICLIILFAFRRFSNASWFVGLLVGCTLFYTLNVYASWISPFHMTALFGFVFYVWLGMQMNRHQEKLLRTLSAIPFWGILSVLVSLLGLSIWESYRLTVLGDGIYNSMNTLRFFNQAYSVGVFLLIMKSNGACYPRFLKPRDESYGIHLVHTILLLFLNGLIIRLFGLPQTYFDPNHLVSIISNICISIARFLVVYVLSVIFVKVLLASRFRWTLGK
jgi:surface polysaccharide O-acyltransferase-like enzyme